MGKLNVLYGIENSIGHDKLDKKNVILIRHDFEPGFDINQAKEILNPGYSRLRVIVDDIDEEEISRIIEEYFKGIKEIVFVTDKLSLIQVVSMVNAQFVSRNIHAERNDIRVGTDQINLQDVGSSFRCFNFEIHAVENLESICQTSMLVEEGQLNDFQRKALEKLAKRSAFNFEQYLVEHASTEKNILVKAGAGTGKTYSMVSRIAYLCNRAIDPVLELENDIAMVTFTRDAADNMKSRLKDMFMNYYILTRDDKYLRFLDKLGYVQVSTIHKFALSILRRSCLRLGMGSEFEISGEKYERQQIYHRLLNHYIEEHQDAQINIYTYNLEDKLIDFSNKLYEKGFDVTTFDVSLLGDSPRSFQDFNNLVKEVVIPAEIEYFSYNKERNRIELRQSIAQLNRLVEENHVWETGLNYKYLLVDEFQDTDESQIQIILGLQKIFGDRSKLFVVGDLKQSIYRFRGATISAFDDVMIKPNEWEQFSLITNYRTDRRLLDLFNHRFSRMAMNGYLLYQEDSDRLKGVREFSIPAEALFKKIQSQGKGDVYDLLFEEVKYQLGEIDRLEKEGHLSSQERTVAILVRLNAQVDNIVEEGRKRNIDVEVQDGGDLFRLPSTLDLYKLVLALVNSTNPQYLVNLLQSSYVSLKINYTGLNGLDKDDKYKAIVNILDVYFRGIMNKSWNEIVVDCQTRPVLAVLKDIYENSCPWKIYVNEEKQKSYRQNYEYLIEQITQRYFKKFLTLNMIEKYLRINITTREEHQSRNVANLTGKRVICYTIHGSKGLEFGSVIMPFTNVNLDKPNEKGMIVNKLKEGVAYRFMITTTSKLEVNVSNQWFDNDLKNENKENARENTRLLYVAMTRAIRSFTWINPVSSTGETWASLLEE